jgi:hypothetical protein
VSVIGDKLKLLEEMRALAQQISEGRYTSARAQADDARRLAAIVLLLNPVGE